MIANLKQEYFQNGNVKIEDVSFLTLKNTLAEKMADTFKNRESLNSSGTVSRKTSTASEYTPENTFVHESRNSNKPKTSISSEMSISEGIQEEMDKNANSVEGRSRTDLKPGSRVSNTLYIFKKTFI